MSICNIVMETTMSKAKKLIRKNMKDVINQMTHEEKVRQSKAVYQKIVNLPQYQTSKKISLYLSTDNEVNTLSILQHIFISNKEAFVPRYEGKSMIMMKLKSMEEYDNLPVTKWNIKQPAYNENSNDDAQKNGGLDLIILPGVAFTSTGKRLGHGMGYYDKFLSNLLNTQSNKPHLIAIAFNQQILNDIPTTENDILMDLVITEKSMNV